MSGKVLFGNYEVDFTRRELRKGGNPGGITAQAVPGS